MYYKYFLLIPQGNEYKLIIKITIQIYPYNKTGFICFQANIKEETVTIPHKLHNSIIGAKGRLIRSIMDECGGVIIRFPPEGNTSDKVTIRGPKADVENAKQQLLELTNEKVSYQKKILLSI